MLKYKIPQIVTLTRLFQIELSYKKGSVSERSETLPFLVSLLSDSNQRPRDYKSRALAN